MGIWEPTRLRKPFSRYGQNTYCIGFEPHRLKPISSCESMDWHLSCTLEPHSAAALSLSVGCGSTRSQRALMETYLGLRSRMLGARPRSARKPRLPVPIRGSAPSRSTSGPQRRITDSWQPNLAELGNSLNVKHFKPFCTFGRRAEKVRV